MRTLCRALHVSPSGFYAWQQRPLSARQQLDRRLCVHLRAAHGASDGTYGSPRLQQALQTAGLAIGRNRVIRLMRREQLVGRPRRRFRVTTEADPAAAWAPNQLNQTFTTSRPNDVWAGDITAIPTTDGWLYLAVLLDLFSRRVVGWAVAPTCDTSLVLRAWQRALAQRQRPPRLHHSDRGGQYTSARYQHELARHRVACSMSRRGNCFDNAVVESFFRTVKVDLDRRLRTTRLEAAQHLATYIDGFYNTRRLHSTLGYLSPAEFERRHRRAR